MMTVKEYKEQVYKEYTDEINLISKASECVKEEGLWKADIGVATDMFINFVGNNEESIFVNVPEAKARIEELRAQVTED